MAVAWWKVCRESKVMSKTYKAWAEMRQRCLNPSNKNYASYGGRGIKIASEWNDFLVFYADMGKAPEDRSLGRLNNDGDYCKDNCAWQTSEEQNNNRRQRRITSRNTSGLLNVLYDKSNEIWVAKAVESHNVVYLYRGKDFFEACCARKSWEARIQS